MEPSLPPPSTGPPRAKLLIGGLYRTPDSWNVAEEALVEEFGPLGAERLVFPFAHSSYYRDEMGDGLNRIFRVHEEPVAQEDLARIKHRTGALELRLAETSEGGVRRRVNIDPGLLTLANLVLASTKGYAHRVYLGQGIHAEVALVFRKSGFQPVPWTYPDYRRPEALGFFNRQRHRWLLALRGRGPAPRPPER